MTELRDGFFYHPDGETPEQQMQRLLAGEHNPAFDDLFSAVARQPSCPGATTTFAGFEAAGVGLSFGVLSQFSPSSWLSLMVVAGVSA